MGNGPSWSTASSERAYRRVAWIARGGMGEVELVVRREGTFSRLHARKRLTSAHREDPGFRSMFMDEARLAGLIRHPNVVSVVDVGEDDDGPFLIMDFVDGLPAAKLVAAVGDAGRRLPVQIAVRIALDAARGLAAVHDLRGADGVSLSLVHRDVSPQNILIGFDGVARVSDFGIAKALGNATRTTTGILKGSLGYMSPEQLRFEEPDRRSDLFSLGITLWELLSGRRLYGGREGDTGFEAARRILSEPPPDIGDEREEVPPALVELLLELLAKDPAQRPPDASALAARLETVLGALVAEEGVLDVREYLRTNLDHLRVEAEQQRTRALAELERSTVAAARRRRTLIGVAAALGIVGAASAASLLLWPRAPAALPPRSLWTGGWHTCALDDGRLYCWGKNNESQLGLGHSSDRGTRKLVELRDVVAADGGSFHTCACTADGRLHCWGRGAEGQLGVMAAEALRKPTAIPGITDCRDVAAGALHTCVLRASGQVACFGDNAAGQLGDGTLERRSVPTIVPGLAGVAQIAATRDYTCARLASGTVSCWGANDDGKLGDGTRQARSSPVPVQDLSDAADIALAFRFGCAARRNGRVRCWGARADADLGRLTDVVQLAAGLDHACALRRDGRAACWGDNRLGQLGDGTLKESSAPVDVLDVTDFVLLMAGESHTCGRHGQGLSCWGVNATGQLGDGTADSKVRPVSVAEFDR